MKHKSKGHLWGKSIHQHRSNKRRFELREAGGLGFTKEEWKELKKKTGSVCACCLKPEAIARLIPDHIEPLSAGGINEISNIQPLCRVCNSGKGNKAINYLKMNFKYVL